MQGAFVAASSPCRILCYDIGVKKVTTSGKATLAGSILCVCAVITLLICQWAITLHIKPENIAVAFLPLIPMVFFTLILFFVKKEKPYIGL